MDIEQQLRHFRGRVEAALEHWLPPQNVLPGDLHAAMRYAVVDGGKRVRPLLAYAAGTALGADETRLDGAATAVELIHAYSLVHDDLPAMDDDALRRGKPTCHKAYGEAVAILAGDALQALAFQILAQHTNGVAPEQRLAMIEALAVASGSRGMAGGQAIDLAAVGRRLELPELENMHIHKTGALIRASVRLGALCADAPGADMLDSLDHYSKCIGLAFQIRDDILDIEGETAALGKTQGADRARDKPTYPEIIGLEASKEMAEDLYNEALESLAPLGEGGALLQALARFVVQRGH